MYCNVYMIQHNVYCAGSDVCDEVYSLLAGLETV